MTLFHRFAVPTYAGGLPAGYDFINNAGGGTPAFADGAKTAGPNVGTYFVAFGEDATSSDVNRPAQALAQNTDFLDDTLHRDIALPVRTSNATGAPTSFLLITGPGIFMGLGGALLADLFQVTDQNDEAITVGDTEIVISSAVDSGSVPVGGGFSLGNVTVTFNIAVPSGQMYHVWYGERTNFATFPADGLTSSRIRSLTEVDAEIEELFYNLHGNNLAWNAPWTSTIWDLAGSGLNERYSREPLVELSPPESYWSALVDTPGAGGWIKRTGPALTIYSAGDSSALSDPINALFTAKSIDTVPISSGGVVGFASFGTRRSSTAFSSESGTGRTPGTALFLGLWPHDLTTNTDFATNIVAGSTVTLANVGSYNIDTGTAQVTLTAPSYSNNGTDSSIAVGYDFLELQYFISGVQHNETVVITYIATGTPLLIDVRYPNGTVPDWSTVVPTGATARWVSTSFAVGDGAGSFHQAVHSDPHPVLLDGLYYQVPQTLGDPVLTDTVPRIPASFSASTNVVAALALQWGGFSSAVPSGPVFPSSMRGDGSIYVTSTANNGIAGVFVGSSAGTGGTGLTGTAGGTAGLYGVFGSGGTGTGAGGFFQGGTNNGLGVQGVGHGTGTGGYFQGGATGAYGCWGVGSGSSDGVHGDGGVTGSGVSGYGGPDDGRSGGGNGGYFYGGADGGGGGGAGTFSLGGPDAGNGGGIGAYAIGGYSADELLCGAGVLGVGGGGTVPVFSVYQGSGGYFAGGIGDNYGVYAQGTGAGSGIYSVGGATGYGGYFIGNGTKHGVLAAGGTTGAGGSGGFFSGGGTAGPGVTGYGAGSGPGGDFYSQASSAAGVRGTGFGTSAGGAFYASAPSTGDSIYCADGGIHLDYVIPGGTPWTTATGANKLFGDNIVKAWGTCIINGGGITVEDGFNIASVAISGTDIKITMTRSLSNNYCVVANVNLGTGASLFGTVPIGCIGNPPGGDNFTLRTYTTYGGASEFDYSNVSLGVSYLFFVVLGHEVP
jgi:hypothetical protein